jgi:uroporphyrinogen-III synthase
MHKGALVALTGTDTASLEEEVRKACGKPVVFPVVAIQARKLSKAVRAPLHALDHYDWLIFTSKHAVKFFIKALWDERIVLPKKMPRIAAVGPETARAVTRAHLRVDVLPKRSSATFLVATLGKKISGKRVLFPRSAIAPMSAVNALRTQGARVTEMPLYTVAHAKIPLRLVKLLTSGAASYLVFMSPSGVRGLMDNVVNKNAVRRIPAVCVGPTSAHAARAAGFANVHTAKKPTTKGIVDLLRKLP